MPEFGQCVHKIARDAGDPDRLYLQNHHGVYRSDDGGATWTSIADGLPTDFGFAMVAHPRRGERRLQLPDRRRRRCGCRPTTPAACSAPTDAGATWTALTDGLPQHDYYGSVLRDAMCADDADPAGSTSARATARSTPAPTRASSWSLVAAHLPDVLCVRAARSGDGDRRRVVLPGVLRQYADGAARVEIDLPDGATVGDAARRARRAASRRSPGGSATSRASCAASSTSTSTAPTSRPCGGLAAPVAAGAEVLVLPSVAGG